MTLGFTSWNANSPKLPDLTPFAIYARVLAAIYILRQKATVVPDKVKEFQWVGRDSQDDVI